MTEEESVTITVGLISGVISSEFSRGLGLAATPKHGALTAWRIGSTQIRCF